MLWAQKIVFGEPEGYLLQKSEMKLEMQNFNKYVIYFFFCYLFAIVLLFLEQYYNDF